MPERLTNTLLSKAARIAEEMQKVQGRLTEAFEERYGVTYSAVDADEIIEVLDYHGGSITVAECDRIMADLGYPRIGL